MGKACGPVGKRKVVMTGCDAHGLNTQTLICRVVQGYNASCNFPLFEQLTGSKMISSFITFLCFSQLLISTSTSTSTLINIRGLCPPKKHRGTCYFLIPVLLLQWLTSQSKYQSMTQLESINRLYDPKEELLLW